MTSDLASRLAQTDPRLLLPADESSPPERLELMVALRLPATDRDRFLALAVDPGGAAHLVPVVDDLAGLRRARPGDGVAVGVIDLLGADQVGAAYQVRRGTAAVPKAAPADERHLADGSDREVYTVGDLRVSLTLSPEGSATPVPDVVGELDRGGFRGMLPWLGDVVVDADGRSFGPVARVAGHPSGVWSLNDRLIGLVAGHLRGGDEAAPTLAVAGRLGRALADLHLALSAIPASGSTGRTASEDDVADWRREASDAFAEAVVLAEGEPGERLRARRTEVRATLDDLSASVGAPLLPALPVPGPAAFLLVGDELLLDPLAPPVVGTRWRSPVRDVAATVRGVDHIARGIHRRLVAGGFPAPAERVTSWYGAVRAAVLDSYRAHLAAEGAPDLLDERLLLAFEVETECRALSRASRYLPTTRGIADAALADLLSAI